MTHSAQKTEINFRNFMMDQLISISKLQKLMERFSAIHLWLSKELNNFVGLWGLCLNLGEVMYVCLCPG